ncbi:MAG: efflux RND transporter periplasmic adaptor subunit [Verrucomicrobia bacterium]|nr:efflux RND transporter periplasmic adaptor subunit [Verrucomicrobiota bacterium]
MKKLLKPILILLLVAGAAFLGFRILKTEPPAAVDEHGHGAETAKAEKDEHGDHAEHGGPEAHGEGEEPVKGPHGGRLLTEGRFQTEVTIYEPPGIEPQFRVYFYNDGKPIPPAGINLTITLTRINQTDTVKFKPEDDFLAGDLAIFEPHSFDVRVVAQQGGKDYEWEYESYEGRVEISAESVKQAAIGIETAGPAKLNTKVELNGKIRTNEEETAHVMPRYPGVVKSVKKKLGDAVKKGEVLAVVESNDSLQPYEIKAEIDGTIIAKDVTLGEFVSGQEAIFTIANLGTVWADFNVYRQDFPLLRVGQTVVLDGGPGMEKTEAKISYISPFGAENSQTMLARALVPNASGEWRPGIFVRGDVIIDAEEVPVAVKASALQTFRDWDVVFLNVGDLFEVAPVEIGRRDSEWVEIKAGLKAGAHYAAENSYIIKADIGKSGASHDH